MDFSFVSSNTGVPFATNMGALTVTRCESAARYIIMCSSYSINDTCLWEWNTHVHVVYICIVWVHVPTHYSCSQCLQTDNACGWCIYNKVCSGTPAPCTNETSWLQVSLWHDIILCECSYLFGHDDTLNSWKVILSLSWCVSSLGALTLTYKNYLVKMTTS